MKRPGAPEAPGLFVPERIPGATRKKNDVTRWLQSPQPRYHSQAEVAQAVALGSLVALALTLYMRRGAPVERPENGTTKQAVHQQMLIPIYSSGPRTALSVHGSGVHSRSDVT